MDRQIDPRQFIGQLVTDEIARGSGGLSQRKLVKFCEYWEISRQAVYDVQNGKPTVRADTLRSLEGALQLPTRLFNYIIDGDIERIRKLPTKEQGGLLRADLKEWIIDGMQSMTLPRDRRVEDRHRNHG